MATKIGVYFDSSAIGGGLDVSSLASGVTKRFKDFAVVVKEFPVMSSPASVKEIADDIEENALDGILLCGSSPRVDWDIYRFPGIQIEHVNLREGCVLAYQNPDGSHLSNDPDSEAPELLWLMAVDYINMGVLKLQKTSIPKPEIVESFTTILVLGGGWTGLSAARAASKAGYKVILVENADSLGGKANIMKKSIPLSAPHTTMQDTGIELKVAAAEKDANITIFVKSELTKLAGAPGQYIATVKTPSDEQNFEVGAVVLATGWQPQDTAYLRPLGYGETPAVMTASEFEKKSKAGEITAKRVAFVLDTSLCDKQDCSCEGEDTSTQTEAATKEPEQNKEGSEAEATEKTFTDLEQESHLAYSNAVASVVALKHAQYVVEQPDGIAYILYDSITAQGIHERFYKAAQNHPRVMLTKATVTSVTPSANGATVVAENTLLGGPVALDVELVVLPTGIVPTTAKSAVVQLEYRQGPALPDLELFNGYADSNYICFPYETRRTGIYAAGCVRQPMTFDAAEEDANGAVLKAIQCIESSNRGVAVHPRSGDLSYPVFNFVRCTQCKRCTEECPFGALDDDEKGTPKPNYTRCRRCGTCMGACPERVISFDSYNIDQVGSMIRDIKVPDDMNEGGPRVVILACENDAYPALDMAALRGKTWSPYVRVIPVRCLGSVNAIWIADAMSKGIDGVMLMGCKYGDDYQCHFVKGSEICNRRKDNIAETLDRLGVEPDRVAQYQVAIDEYDSVPIIIEEFMQMIFEKGPNPFKGY